MSDQFKLAIENIVEVPVKFTLKEGKVDKLFAFTLLCDRLDQDEIGTVLEENEHKVKAFMARVTKGWEGQRLVLTTDKQPAEFGTEALAVMLSAAGVAMTCYNAYGKHCGAKEKN